MKYQVLGTIACSGNGSAALLESQLLGLITNLTDRKPDVFPLDCIYRDWNILYIKFKTDMNPEYYISLLCIKCDQVKPTPVKFNCFVLKNSIKILHWLDNKLVPVC